MTAIALAALALAAVFAGLWLRERSRCARARDQAATARRQADHAGDARESFFDLVTHELRSPLSAILGYQELLRDGAFGELDEAAEEPIERIGRSAHHLLHLIDGVVELSRLRAGTVRPRTGPVDLGAILPGIADAFRRLARDRGMEPIVRMPDRLPTLNSDPDRLVRALDLLVTSAVKHPAGPSIQMDVEAAEDAVTVRIHDTEIPSRRPADDPALAFGIRIAVADRVAALLGGELIAERHDNGPIRALSFRFVDLPPTAGSGL